MKLKKITALLLALLMLVSLVSCASKSEAPKGMKNIAREKDPFNFYVPLSWVTNSADIVGAYYSTYDKSNITIMPYGGDFASTDEYWDDFKTRCAAEFSEFEVIKEKEAKVVSGRNALQYTYKLKVDGKVYKCRQTVMLYSNNLLYVITYTAAEENYDAHVSEIDNILSVFAFK